MKKILFDPNDIIPYITFDEIKQNEIIVIKSISDNVNYYYIVSRFNGYYYFICLNDGNIMNLTEFKHIKDAFEDFKRIYLQFITFDVFCMTQKEYLEFLSNMDFSGYKKLFQIENELLMKFE